MRRFLPLFFSIAVALMIGFVSGLAVAHSSETVEINRVVAMGWGDGKYGDAFYGALVYLEPQSSGYAVRAKVYIGRDNIGRGTSYIHDCGQLGTVKTHAEAVAQWGAIAWSEAGLRIGTSANGYFLARNRLENHR
ncbi:hypothetical protein [Nodosilinea sp. FACHB-13]|uniref:hypothetical protein n=1 Tax=Cyanophyceae TaxID=3028117 RepID=UPI0016866F74|nr:hypothetical protein [Nodosilinea sp. FACHB-13]MBD2108323.1 hypothetical protein [Nodosilinea sp. FACHB-13]